MKALRQAVRPARDKVQSNKLMAANTNSDQGARTQRQRGWRLAAKRMVDLSASLLGLLIAAPIIAFVALLVRISYGSPVLFRHQRPGRDNKLFHVYKFRTMSNERDADGKLLPDAQRLTRLGRTLRSTSLDELPQLWNVLQGHLSLVGPRPLFVHYLELYDDEQKRRHDVLPGITGWAQIKGRNAISWEEKFELDLWYVDRWNFWLDIKILFLTLPAVLLRRGVSADNHATMPNFTGSTKKKSPGEE